MSFAILAPTSFFVLFLFFLKFLPDIRRQRFTQGLNDHVVNHTERISKKFHGREPIDITLIVTLIKGTLFDRINISVKMIGLFYLFFHFVDFIRKNHIFIFFLTISVIVKEMGNEILNGVVRVLLKLRVEEFVAAMQQNSIV